MNTNNMQITCISQLVRLDRRSEDGPKPVQNSQTRQKMSKRTYGPYYASRFLRSLSRKGLTIEFSALGEIIVLLHAS